MQATNEDVFEIAYWRKAKQMQFVGIFVLWSKCLEETFEKPQRRKAKELQLTQFFVHLCRHLEDAFENEKCGNEISVIMYPAMQAI